MFDHFLITRFNLRNPEWQLTKNNESLLDDAWMEERLALFSNFCFPSVVAQSNQNFRWLIFFDVATQPAFKAQITSLIGPFPFISAAYIEGMPAFYEGISSFVSQSAAPFLITSRIDNDDCIHKEFINVVQQQFDKQPYRAIDIVKGYSLQVEPHFMLGKKEHLFNPFISLIEKNENPKTVWFNDHNLWKKESRITTISNRRLWMSIIHGKNKVNEFDGYGSVDFESIRKDFIFSEAMQKKIGAALLPYEKWRFLSFRNRLYVKWVLFNKQFKRTLGLYKLK